MPFRRRWAPSGTVTRGSSPVLGSLSARATDVERQPFRSMGFVSVIIVSLIFALGLPVMLL